MKQDSRIDKTFKSIMPARLAQISANARESTSKAKMQEVMKTSFDVVKKMPDRLIEDMIPIYEKYFTEDEIKDYLSFYRSTSGQKMIDEMTAISGDLMKVMMEKYMPDIQKSYKKQFENAKPLPEKQ